MKKKLLIGGFIVSMLALTGCDGYDTGEVLHDGNFKAFGQKGDYDILKDTKTGCLYLQHYSEFDLDPYYDENGDVKGCGDKGEDY